MLEFATQGRRLGMSLIVNHDDNTRDIAYTAGAEKVLGTAKAQKWTIVSMKDDWNGVFAD